MKKSIILLTLFGLFVLGCKKNSYDSGTAYTASFPIITITGAPIYDIAVGASLPTIAATAYDTVYKENCPITIDKSTLDNTTPGLYSVNISATNHLGYQSTSSVLIAVTNTNPAEDISGLYTRVSNGDTVHVTRIGNGLYQTDNIGGSPSLKVSCYFIVIGDTTLSAGTNQITSDGVTSIYNAQLSLTPGDTTFQYKVSSASFGTALRVFQKH